jgi:hypothetical protein
VALPYVADGEQFLVSCARQKDNIDKPVNIDRHGLRSYAWRTSHKAERAAILANHHR